MRNYRGRARSGCRAKYETVVVVVVVVRTLLAEKAAVEGGLVGQPVFVCHFQLFNKIKCNR